MPPRKKMTTNMPTIDNDVTREPTETTAAPVKDIDPYGIEKGKFVHIVIAGQARHKSAEVLRVNPDGLTLRTHPHGLSQAEVTFVPWVAIEGVGIIGAR